MAKARRNQTSKAIRKHRQAQDVKSVEVPQGLVVYLKETDLHYLNPTAATIFLLCAVPLTDSQLATILHEEYALNEVPMDEVKRCLAELVEAKIIVVEGQ